MNCTSIVEDFHMPTGALVAPSVPFQRHTLALRADNRKTFQYGMFVATIRNMPRKVLVVEDDAITRLDICDFLRQEGFEVEQIPDGIRALERFKNQAFDLILTDFRMPGMDGLNLVQRIRSVSPSTPVIIMTGTSSLNKRRAQSAGATDFIRKPLHLERLVDKIRKLLKPGH